MAESIRAAAAWTYDGAMLRATARNAAALKTRDLEIIVDRCVLRCQKERVGTRTCSLYLFDL